MPLSLPKKLPAGRKTTLLDKMAENEDLSEKRRGGGASYVVRQSDDGSGPPELSDAITALMIMAGVEARWVSNFWQLIGPNGKRSGVSRNGDFEEWRTVISNMAPDPFKTR